MQLEPILDPAALWYSREPPVMWAELLLAYTHIRRNGTADDIFTFFFKADWVTEPETKTALVIVKY